MSTYIRYINTSMLNIRSPMNIILRFRFFRTNPHICRKTSSTMPLMLTWLIALKFHSSFLFYSYHLIRVLLLQFILFTKQSTICTNRYNADVAIIMTNTTSHPFIVFCILSLCHSMAKKMPKSLRRGYWLVGQCVIGVDG